MRDRRNEKNRRWESWVADALKGRCLHEPPETTLRRAVALGRRLPRRVGAGQWIATLLFDSSAQPALGLRRFAVRERRLLYGIAEPAAGEDSAEPGARELDLLVRRGPDGDLELTGQLLPPDPPARVVVAAAGKRRTATPGREGDFVVTGLPDAEITLEVVAGEGRRVVIDLPRPEDEQEAGEGEDP